jgi:hypothetical protein
VGFVIPPFYFQVASALLGVLQDGLGMEYVMKLASDENVATILVIAINTEGLRMMMTIHLYRTITIITTTTIIII